ncbi:noggin-2-like [Haliotis rufescens]|uniref:noggin-2-like n=1 Tax=Haliotis rufescens TaxID=6454 RepID=UPI001EAF9D51|nr:noggin-2-like [Haliotis rufescens]XP_046337220.1 noggin-2-like [Haliotis rufescens]
MRMNDVLHSLMSVVVGVQLLGDVVGNMAPFMRRAIQPSLPVNPASQGLMLKIPIRDSDLLRLKPRKKHLKTHKLMKRLSGDFNKNYMSVERPSIVNEIIVQQVQDETVDAVQSLDIDLTDINGLQLQLNQTVIQAMQSWLVRRASCPVHYRWEDLGSFFWPRWIKRGECVGTPSCSWPPGMHCIPTKSRRIKILRWHCRPWRGGRGRGRRPSRHGGNTDDDSNDTETWVRPHRGRHVKLGKRCKWVKVPYPITDSCYCGC